MNFVKLGKQYINPLQVLRVLEWPRQGDDDQEVVIELINGQQIIIQDTLVHIVGLLNEGL